MKIIAQNLHKKYGEKVAVEDISLQIRPGQVLGLLGPNGAGKSTTIKMLSGQTKPTSGTITIDNKTYEYIPAQLRGKIGVMPQEIVVWDDLNIKENLQFTATLQDMPPEKTRNEVDYLIEILQLQPELNTLARDLSGGYRRRLNLALSIIHQPQVVFLDEPTPGIDAQSRRFLMDFINDLGHQHGLAVVLTDHYLDEAEKLSDYVIIIDHGQVVTEGTVTQLKNIHGDGNLLHLDFAPEIAKESDILERVRAELEHDLHDVKLAKNTITTLVKDPQQAFKESFRVLKKYNINALNVAIKEPSLEDIFLLLTGRDIRE